MYGECAGKFYTYYSSDILMNQSFPEMLDFLEHRYFDMSFFGVDIPDSNEIQQPERQFTCIRENVEPRNALYLQRRRLLVRQM
ncbi:hypothetical protein DPMN_180285 [Dreissena polymorpha]|uniref:Uncharacterized protein n=1 Tax=Dreissena polymorpha TaxID=45954 RepID=A0A9D4EGD9_DREPO|nr:hypothetical protein DPMN_180285 [Dreissena polymorpha]